MHEHLTPDDAGLLAAMMTAAASFIEAAEAAPGAPAEAPALLTVTYYPVSQRVHVVCRDADGRARRVFRAHGDEAIAAAVGTFLQRGLAHMPDAKRRQALALVNADQAVLAVQLTRDPDTATVKLLTPIPDDTGTVQDVDAPTLFTLTTPETLH